MKTTAKILRKAIGVAVFMLIYHIGNSVYAQTPCVGCTWIEVSPTGQTLICTLLSSGATYCEVQTP